MTDLNTLLGPGSQWVLVTATAINPTDDGSGSADATGIVPTIASTATNTAATTMSPCANAITAVSRCTSVKPSAISPYAAPVARPATSAWTATAPLTS